MARTSASGLVTRRSIRFDVPAKGRPAHENPPPQPVRPDLTGPYQFVGLGPSDMHVLLHLGTNQIEREYYAFWLKSRSNALIREFAEVLKELFKSNKTN